MSNNSGSCDTFIAYIYNGKKIESTDVARMICEVAKRNPAKGRDIIGALTLESMNHRSESKSYEEHVAKVNALSAVLNGYFSQLTIEITDHDKLKLFYRDGGGTYVN